MFGQLSVEMVLGGRAASVSKALCHEESVTQNPCPGPELRSPKCSSAEPPVSFLSGGLCLGCPYKGGPVGLTRPGFAAFIS